ncbi:MAG: GHMP kinase [Dehalococcoidales bacterium]|nr:GHMP kinase [Dehalococcoidales bacterium]
MIIVQTPVRISFLGGGTDFEDYYISHGGAVVSTTIDKYIFVIVKERFDDLICINYSKKEEIENVNEIKHDLVREAMKITGITRGIEITTIADIPSDGTGLGSSSAVTIGLLQALYTYQGEIVSAETLAEQACEIEIQILGKPIGKQDQYITAYGGTRFIEFNGAGVKTNRINVHKDNLRRLNENLMLYYTGVKRDSSEVLSEQKKEIQHNLYYLTELKNLAYEGKSKLENGSYHELGELLHKNWLLKKQLSSKITNSRIDDLYESARKAGAIGGKICGSGGGGALLLYCLKEKQDSVRSTLNKLREIPFRFENDGSKVILNYRRNQ